LIYFGKVENDPKGEAALNLWLDEKDQLLAGRTPRRTPDGLTVRDLCNHFLTVKDQQRDAGELAKAMILLGINCGFGNADCGKLPLSAIDFKAGWVNFPRPKTAVERRCPLWPETITAL
jgi:integrase